MSPHAGRAQVTKKGKIERRFRKGTILNALLIRISFFIYSNEKCQKNKIKKAEGSNKWILVLEYVNLYSTHSIKSHHKKDRNRN